MSISETMTLTLLISGSLSLYLLGQAVVDDVQLGEQIKKVGGRADALIGEDRVRVRDGYVGLVPRDAVGRTAVIRFGREPRAAPRRKVGVLWG